MHRWVDFLTVFLEKVVKKAERINQDVQNWGPLTPVAQKSLESMEGQLKTISKIR